MKYCPYCGANIVDGAAFCLECGSKLPVIKQKDEKRFNQKKEKCDKEKKEEKSIKKKQTESNKNNEIMDNDYDGYYDDVIPSDRKNMDNKAEYINSSMIKQIVLLIVGVLFIIAFCVLIMYLL